MDCRLISRAYVVFRDPVAPAMTMIPWRTSSDNPRWVRCQICHGLSVDANAGPLELRRTFAARVLF